MLALRRAHHPEVGQTHHPRTLGPVLQSHLVPELPLPVVGADRTHHQMPVLADPLERQLPGREGRDDVSVGWLLLGLRRMQGHRL